ncbi:hypothetical protein L345_13951, partial [Ophiophagus hannah]
MQSPALIMPRHQTGDSGGPLVCYLSDSKYYVVGITSYGIGCGRPKFPGVYTNLPKYMFWLGYSFLYRFHIRAVKIQTITWQLPLSGYHVLQRRNGTLDVPIQGVISALWGKGGDGSSLHPPRELLSLSRMKAQQ